MKDMLGVGFLYGGYLGTALVLVWLGSMTFERALMLVVLYVATQIRWFSRDESPVEPDVRPKQSFMSRVRGE